MKKSTKSSTPPSTPSKKQFQTPPKPRSTNGSDKTNQQLQPKPTPIIKPSSKPTPTSKLSSKVSKLPNQPKPKLATPPPTNFYFIFFTPKKWQTHSTWPKSSATSLATPNSAKPPPANPSAQSASPPTAPGTTPLVKNKNKPNFTTSSFGANSLKSVPNI